MWAFLPILGGYEHAEGSLDVVCVSYFLVGVNEGCVQKVL